jgi:ATP-dependent 26S proteasome regulatory subunit
MKKIESYIRAGHPAMYAITHEECRFQADMVRLSDIIGYNAMSWSITQGFLDLRTGKQIQDSEGPHEAIAYINKLPDKSMIILKDFHLFLAEQDPDAVLIRTMKEGFLDMKTRGQIVMLCSCRQVLPPEIEKEFVVVEYELPNRDQLEDILKGVAKSAGMKGMTKKKMEELSTVIESATGLTSMEAENAFALSVVETGEFCPKLIYNEKSQIVKKNGFLEIVDVKESLEDIGGLDLAKAWINRRKDAYGAEAKSYGLPPPKGVLVMGIPGTGKSLFSKAIAGVMKRPLLRLDAGKIFGHLVGQSESNLRSIISTVEAIAPCVLFIDEIEKGLSGSQSSGTTDGGTSSRVFGSFLSWLQDKTAPVFVVATANDIGSLPPELLRKGRFDEIFFVDLPNASEREEIWKIQISKYGRDPKLFNIDRLTMMTQRYTGAEIEQAVVEAMYNAFSDNGREVKTDDMSIAVEETMPLSKTMSEKIQQLQEFAENRARPATTRKSKKLSTERKVSRKSDVFATDG